MKSNEKLGIVILITIGIFFALTPININVENREGSSGKRDDITFDHENVKPSLISGPIYIDDNDPNYNWTVAKDAGKCTGQGTYSDPYVIEDFIINGGGGFQGNCILIENSDVFFRIENCTLYNSGITSGNAGIQLLNVSNSLLIDNDCSSNVEGIYLENCNNNTISGNNATNNWLGISLDNSDNNTISGNNATNNDAGISLSNSNNNTISGNVLFRDGIYFSSSSNNTILGNIMNECGLNLYGYYIEDLDSHNIDTTNLVNGKPLYYYTNEVNLGPTDFLNAGQVILVNCNDSAISNLNVSYTAIGISIHYCHNNEIANNNMTNNKLGGIKLQFSDNNTISGNTANGNNGDDGAIYLEISSGNNITGNTVNNNSVGIFLTGGNNNAISGNTINYNNGVGIFLYYSHDNTISGNTIEGNNMCIQEIECLRNEFSDNGSCTYGEEGVNGNGDGDVIPPELIIIISSVIGGGVVIGIAIILVIRRRRKLT